MEPDQDTVHHLADDTGLDPSEITKSRRRRSTTAEHLAADTGVPADEIEPGEMQVPMPKVAPVD